MTKLRLRSKVNFPANVTADGGIAVRKESGQWVVYPKFSDLVSIAASSVQDPTTQQVWIYNPAEDTYAVLTLGGLGDALFKLTSTTSNSIGLGSKTFTVQPNKDVGVGQYVLITDDAAPASNGMYGKITDYTGSSLTVSVEGVIGSGTKTAWTIRVSGATGATGATGTTGSASGVRQTYSTTTADADPGAGTFRLNNATPSSATAAYLDNLDAGGATVSGIFDTWDDSTNTTKGLLFLQKTTDPTVWASFRVTGSVVDGTGYRKLTLSSGAGSGAFTNGDVFTLTFSPAGDAGTKAVISAFDFDAVGDGTSDDTTALQNAINAAQSTGRPLFIPVGTYKTTTGLIVTAPIYIFGAGPYKSIIRPTSGTNGINISPAILSKGPTFENFGIAYSSPAASGDGINVTASSGEVDGAYFRNLAITNAFNGIYFIRAAYWTVDGCAITDSGQSGVFVENQNNIDAGDSTITNSIIFNPTVTGSTNGIVWRGSGGLRISNNKINDVQTGINIQMPSAGGNTGDILITGNSIEAVGLAGVQNGISLQRLGTTGTLHSVLMTGNQLNGWANSINVLLDATGPWITNLTVLGNIIWGNTGAASNGIIVNSVANFVVSDNALRSGGVAGSVALNIGASADTGVVGKNVKIGTWSPDAILGTNIDQPSQAGVTGSVTVNSAFGPLFTGTTAVTFAKPFSTAPKVVVSPNGGGGVGAVCAYAESVTTTGFTVRALGATSGNSFTCNYIASV